MTQSSWTWVVVADAHGASVYKFAEKADNWQFVEHLTADGAGGQQTADFAPKASEHKGALHGHGETTAKAQDERHLAHAVAHALEHGLVDNAFGSLALVAPPKLLGELRENLSRGLQAKVVAELNKEYAHLTIEDLATRLRPELPR
jgi:protein required for attachment to host cells